MSASAKTTPRKPRAAARSYDSWTASASAQCRSTVSGAPSTKCRTRPADESDRALQRRSELNGTAATATASLASPPTPSARAAAVRLSPAVMRANAPSQGASASLPGVNWARSSVSALAVIVPVLSKQTTST